MAVGLAASKASPSPKGGKIAQLSLAGLSSSTLAGLSVLFFYEPQGARELERIRILTQARTRMLGCASRELSFPR